MEVELTICVWLGYTNWMEFLLSINFDDVEPKMVVEKKNRSTETKGKTDRTETLTKRNTFWRIGNASAVHDECENAVGQEFIEQVNQMQP